MTRDDENQAIVLLQKHSIGNVHEPSPDDKENIILMMNDHGLVSVATYINQLNMNDFNNWLINDVYQLGD